MLYALKNGVRTQAKEKLKAVCPICHKSVFASKNDAVIFWSHLQMLDCDPWIEKETVWSILWKKALGYDNSEKILEIAGEKHLADIFTPDLVTIKFLTFPMTHLQVAEIEAFFGERMMWLVDGNDLGNTYSNYFPTDPINLPLSWKSNSWLPFKRPIFIDIQGDNLLFFESGQEVKLALGKVINKERFIRKYRGR